MADFKSRALNWLLGVSHHADSWWLPLVLLAVCMTNSLTSGMFVAVLGVMQSTLFAMIVMARRRSWIIAPMIMCTGSTITALVYIRLLKAIGKETFQAQYGTGSWMQRGQNWIESYGGLGLALLGFSPAPTAIVVLAGVWANLNEATIVLTILGCRFTSLTLGAVATKVATENMSPEDYVRQLMAPSSGDDKPADKSE